jgi:spore coat polysaccharide biosynthesis protein SpsF
MSQDNIIAIIQARMGSSRLPGKVLRDLGGQPVLARVIDRVRRAQTVTGVVVATTTDPADDPIAAFCQQHAVPVFSGSQFDVLDRYYQAAREHQADVVVRITADCPMIDPQEIDRVVTAFLEGEYDFAANRLPPPAQRTSPIGMDTEVCSFAALEQAWQNATEPYEREHVMPYLYDAPGRFRVKIVETEPSLGHLRFTIDTEEDLQVARAIYAAFGNRDDFSLAELLEQNMRHPQWQLNLAGVHHKSLTEVDTRAQENKAEQATPVLQAESATPVCPLCGQQNARVLQRMQSFGFPVVYYHCQACGFVFQDATASRAAQPDFYTETYRKIYQQSEAPTPKDLHQQQLRAQDQIRFLRAQGLQSLSRVLDIGASSGLFLQALQNEFQAEGVGVEPGDAYRALAETQGLHMLPSLPELIAIRPERFDLVSLMHVLEHLPDPVGVLRQIRAELLASQGWLLLEVPNFYAHNSYELAHLSCFTPHTLQEALSKAGYEIISLRQHGYPRSKLFKLYLNVLAQPSANPPTDYEVRPEKAVPLKRSLAIAWRDLRARLDPKRSWLPVEEK